MPHPYEPKMNIRLQTMGSSAIKVLRDGLCDLENTAEAIDNEFMRALSVHRQRKR